MKKIQWVNYIILFNFITCLTNTCIAKQKWAPLFNGKDLSGWHIVQGDAEFKVVDKVITGVTKMGTVNTFLATEKSYSDFILEYEVKIDKPVNSGVQIRSNSYAKYKKGIVHGYQVEIDPTKRGWSGGIYDEGRRGWLYHLEYNPDAKTSFQLGLWNKFRVEAIGSNIRTWVNDRPVANLLDDMTQSGFIALQVHSIGNEKDANKLIQFRNIRIKTITSNKLSDILIPEISYLNNQLSAREANEGWQLLWDGKSNKGWRGAKLNHFPKKGWVINDGILTVLKSSGGESEYGGDIITKKKYKNFILSVDFKVTKGANSGIKYFVDADLNKGKGSAIGCEFQVLDDHHHPDAKKGVKGNRTLASLYDLITADAKNYYPHEKKSKRVNQYDWNRATIIVKDDHVSHYLNGFKVVEYQRNTQMWDALVAYSKYKNWPGFGEQEYGHILLQDHGDEVSFRNIKIKELD